MPGQSTRHGLARGLPDLENQIEVSANSGLRQHAAFNAGQRTSGLGRRILRHEAIFDGRFSPSVSKPRFYTWGNRGSEKP